MQNAFYFPHDYNARNDEKILKIRAKYGWEGYGMYWSLVESMAESANGSLSLDNLDGLAIGLGIAQDKLKTFIADCVKIELFCHDSSDRISTARMERHKKFRKERSSSGRKGARVRWEADGSSAIAQPMGEPMTVPMQRKGKERKGKERTNVRSKGVRPETEALHSAVMELCEQYGVTPAVNIESLDVYVGRYVGKIHMKVEAQHCVAWMLDKGHKVLTTSRLGNWFKKSQEIQKRETLRQLEKREEKNASPVRVLNAPMQTKAFDTETSLKHFADSQSES